MAGRGRVRKRENRIVLPEKETRELVDTVRERREIVKAIRKTWRR